jgi:LPS-assembly lipoprotein
MSRVEQRGAARFVGRLGVVMLAAGFLAGCFQPLYDNRPTAAGGESVRDKLAAVDIPPIPARQGSNDERISVAVRNALQYDLNGAAGANAPTHRLLVTVSSSQITVITDPASGLPTAQVAGVNATYQLLEIATGKIVVKDIANAHVDVDIPGPEQRFAKQRAFRGATERAAQEVAEAIRNRLASYFTAGT